MENYLKIALIGNPNCGKTTFFNVLTGSNQVVGNWPGVTVEKKEGKLFFANHNIQVIDFPGIYSLSPYSPEEEITRKNLLENPPDIIVNVVDATNIKRNLYLTLQLLEFGIPVIIALNMIDVIKKRGDQIQSKYFSDLLGAPVLPISAQTKEGIEDFLTICIQNKIDRKNFSCYSYEINKKICELRSWLEKQKKDWKDEKRFLHWVSIQLIEGDIPAEQWVKNRISSEKWKEFDSCLQQIRGFLGDTELKFAQQRYDAIDQICDLCIKSSSKQIKDFSPKIDRIVTGKLTAFPLFFFLIFLLFYITFGPLGNCFTNWVEYFIQEIILPQAEIIMECLHASDWSKSLILKGILSGVGQVFSFTPQLFLLFSLLALLEDSGYMARAAFIMDRMLRKIGLSGKSFIPLLMGFGCTVPAVMGTRILENKRDKYLTVLLSPFVSCSAKMPIYSLMVATFFEKGKALIIFSLYLLGIIVGVFTAFLFKNMNQLKEETPFVMELPTYRIPSISGIIRYVWRRLKDFLWKAVTILPTAATVVWFLQYFTPEFIVCKEESQSILALLGQKIEPIFQLCGFADWRSVVSLITGFLTKETIVSSLQVLYSTSSGVSLSEGLSQSFTPLSAYAFLIFVLLYPPCMATLSAIHQELKSIKWTITVIIYQVTIAWFCSAFFYQFFNLILKFF